MAEQATAENVEAAASNGPPKTADEIFDEHYPGIRAAKLALNNLKAQVTEQNGEYRNLLKAFVKAGGDSADMIEAMRIASLPVDEATRSIKNINRYLRRMGYPLGTQFGLFEEPNVKSIATQVEDDRNQRIAASGGPKDAGPLRETDKSMQAVEDDGYAAGFGGKEQATNPYTDGAPAFHRWNVGWKKGDDKRNFRPPSADVAPAPETAAAS